MRFLWGTEDRAGWFVVTAAALTLASCGSDSTSAEGEGSERRQQVTASEATKVADKIERLLDRVVRKYESGDSRQAAEFAAEAYLENYEHIEDDVIERAPEVNEELETLLGADLRARIRDGAPESQIREMTERAETLLGDAVEALEGRR